MGNHGSSGCEHFNATEYPMLSEATDGYYKAHGYVMTVLCITVISVNVVNCYVLRLQPMRGFINNLLCGVALCDTVIALLVVVYLIPDRLVSYECEQSRHSHAWATFSLVYAFTSITLHTVSTWLIVTLAVCRLHTLLVRLGQQHFNVIAVCVSVCISVIACVPIYVATGIRPESTPDRVIERNGTNVTQCTGPLINVQRVDKCGPWSKVAAWVDCIYITILPGIALLVSSGWLVLFIRKAQKRHQRISSRPVSGALAGRTNALVIAILLCYLVTQLPKSTVAVMFAVSPYRYKNVYNNLGDVFDLLSMVEGLISFLIYCIMSQQFRRHFLHLLSCFRSKYAFHDPVSL